MNEQSDSGVADALAGAGDRAEDLAAAHLLANVRRRLAGVDEPVVVGRFRLVRELGRGGMGFVYEAHDPSLDRKVAIKILQPDVESAGAVSRLRREAQTLAQLSHPNVVEVFDVGMHDGQLYIAMEMVSGPTLAAWLGEKTRPWPEIRDVFLAAARGLAAAHRAGIVHRDFKPSNVILGDDGRVRVVDFGLARSATATSAETTDKDAWSASPSDGHANTVTAAGAVMGTPAYMSIEQAEGSAADARSDQYSFCVALFEAIWGVPPFPRNTRAAFVIAARDGSVAEVASGRVPKRVRAAVVRGLQPRPDARHRSMDDLIRALRGRRATTVFGAVAVLAAAGAAVTTWAVLPGTDPDPTCDDAGAEIEAHYNAERVEELRAAFAATGLGYATDAADRTVVALDRYAAEYRTVAMQACTEAVGERGADEGIDRTSACLARRRAALSGVVEVLGRADAKTVERATQAVERLPPVALCRDEAWLAAEIEPPPPQVADAVNAAWIRVEVAHGLGRAGRFEEAMAEAQAAVSAADGLGYAPLRLAANFRLGFIQELAGDFAGARATLERTYFAATDGTDHQTALLSAISLVHVVGLRMHDYDEAERWVRHARAELERVQTPEESQAVLLHKIGQVAEARGKFDQALEHHQTALKTMERVHASDPAELAISVLHVGRVLRNLGQLDAALEHYQRALGLWRTSVGPGHPHVGGGLMGLGTIAYQKGDYEGAADFTGRALTIYEQALGREHPAYARGLSNLGNIEVARGNYAEAATNHGDAVEIWERIHGSEHPQVPGLLNNLGTAHQMLRRYDKAAAAYRRALELGVRSLGPDHPDLALMHVNLCEIEREQGDPRAALRHGRQAHTLWDKALGPEHPYTGLAVGCIGSALTAAGQHAQGLEHLQRAVAIYEQAHGKDHPEVAGMLRALGDAQVLAGRYADAIETLTRASRVAEATAVDAGNRGAMRLSLAKAQRAAGQRDLAAASAKAALAHLDQAGESWAKERAQAQALQGP